MISHRHQNTLSQLAPEAASAWSKSVAKGSAWRRTGGVVFGVFFGLGGLWLATAPLNGAVIAEGSLIVDSYRKKIQHLEGGIVKEVLVRAGDHVEAGQPLLKLQEVQADAAVGLLSDRLDAERFREARLEAERMLQEQVIFPRSLEDRSRHSAPLRALRDTERKLFEARRQQLDGQIALMNRQITEVRQELSGLERQFAQSAASAKLISEELAMSEELRSQNYVQKPQVLALKRALSEKQERQGEFEAQIAQSKQKISDLELRILGLKDTYIRNASDELKDARQRILDAEQRLRPSADALARQVITAPVAGEVVEIAVSAAGEVIAPREVIAEIVPRDGNLIVEGKVATGDIAHLKAGDPVSVQLAAYQQRVTPLIDGALSFISPDVLTETLQGMARPYYKVQVTIDRQSLADAGSPQLTPGMPATLFIQTRERTALDYLVEPITDTLRRSFREY